MNKYEFPRIYDFPPFFTIQPNSNTYQSQLEQWKDIILTYCKMNKISALSMSGKPLDSEDDESEEFMSLDDDLEGVVPMNRNNKNEDFSIFRNDKIKRYASNEFILKIYEYLIEENVGEWIDSKKKQNSGIFILWNSIDEWAQILYDWIDNTGQQGKILTIYEIRKGDLSLNQEFYNINYQLLIRIIERLVKQGKASLMKDEDNSIVGVKFGG